MPRLGTLKQTTDHHKRVRMLYVWGKSTLSWIDSIHMMPISTTVAVPVPHFTRAFQNDNRARA